MPRKKQFKRFNRSTRKNNTPIAKMSITGTRRYSSTQRQSIAHCHNMLNTSSKNYSSIGRKIRSFVPCKMRLPTSDTMLGKHTTQLMNILQKKTSSNNQLGGGQHKYISEQVKRKQYIELLKYI